MTLTEILLIIIIHWIADFVMQDEKWALGKSKNWTDLLSHTFVYSIIWILPMWMLISFYSVNTPYWVNVDNMVLFCIITFIFHTATDYITSKIVSKKFAEETPYNLKLDTTILHIGDTISSYSDHKHPHIIMDAYDNHYKVKRYNSIPNFGAFSLIGFDQVLHYIQLFGTYYLLVKI